MKYKLYCIIELLSFTLNPYKRSNISMARNSIPMSISFKILDRYENSNFMTSSLTISADFSLARYRRNNGIRLEESWGCFELDKFLVWLQYRFLVFWYWLRFRLRTWVLQTWLQTWVRLSRTRKGFGFNLYCIGYTV